jgi:hypothetical protein
MSVRFVRGGERGASGLYWGGGVGGNPAIARSRHLALYTCPKGSAEAKISAFMRPKKGRAPEEGPSNASNPKLPEGASEGRDAPRADPPRTAPSPCRWSHCAPPPRPRGSAAPARVAPASAAARSARRADPPPHGHCAQPPCPQLPLRPLPRPARAAVRRPARPLASQQLQARPAERSARGQRARAGARRE